MNITIHSKYGCPYCDKIKAVLDQREMEYTVLTLEEDFTEAEFREEFGDEGEYPMISIGMFRGTLKETLNHMSDRGMFV